MALRLFRYMFKIAEYHKKSTKSKKFPFIYPLIFYNGVQKYNAPRNLWELFENSELVKATWTNDYQLINVHDIPDEKLKEKAWSGILQFFMKHIHERDLLKRQEEVADLLPKFAKIDIGIDYIELILCYTLTRIKQDDVIEIEKLLKSKLNPKKRENIMKSIAHHWIQQGKAEEREEAKAEAVKLVNIKMQKEKITMVKKMLKEGIPLESVIKITKLSKEDLEK